MKWWGYIHVNGSIQVKRYWGDTVSLQEAEKSPFVKMVSYPFEAGSREEAYGDASDRYTAYLVSRKLDKSNGLF